MVATAYRRTENASSSPAKLRLSPLHNIPPLPHHPTGGCTKRPVPHGGAYHGGRQCGWEQLPQGRQPGPLHHPEKQQQPPVTVLHESEAAGAERGVWCRYPSRARHGPSAPPKHSGLLGTRQHTPVLHAVPRAFGGHTLCSVPVCALAQVLLPLLEGKHKAARRHG